MIRKKIITFIFISLCFLVCTSFHFEEDTIDHFTPNKKFDWLKEVKMLSETLSLEHFEKTKGRSFDSANIYMTDGKYHPVSIFQYGIVCFDIYRKTNNAEYKKKCLNQFKYFQDSTKYVMREDGSIGFPYKITWRDLKPDWFSGLAQGEGIMFLIRYYYLTKDEKALDLIQRVKKFMLTTVDCGGTLNNLSDTTVWIEEYANSKTKVGVINGFVTAIMGLREYCNLFPGDVETKKIYEKCLYSHKALFYKYDTGNGIYYDMGEKQVVGPWYSKWQVIQMKQMFEMLGDTFYKNIEMLWSSYAYNKTVPGMTGGLLTDTNFSSPAVISKEGWIEPSTNYKEMLKSDSIYDICVNEKMSTNGIKNLFDGNDQTSFTLRNIDSTQQIPYIEFETKSSLKVNSISLKPVKDSLDYTGYRFYTKEKESDKWAEVKVKSVTVNEKKYLFSFKEIKCSQFRIEFSLLVKKNPLALAEINLLNSDRKYLTHLSHFITSDYALTDPANIFTVRKKNVDDFVIFYKTGNTAQELGKNKWEVYKAIRSEKFNINSKDRYCRFLVIFKNNSFDSSMMIQI